MILITGLPNAGKTTFSATYQNVIHLDEVGYDGVFALVASTKGAVIEGAFGRKKRVELLKHSNDNRNVCIYLNVPVNKCLNRECRGRNEKMLRLYMSQFEPPTLDEGWDEIIIIGDNNGKLNEIINDA